MKELKLYRERKNNSLFVFLSSILILLWQLIIIEEIVSFYIQNIKIRLIISIISLIYYRVTYLRRLRIIINYVIEYAIENYLIISINSFFAADLAGIHPNTIPISMDTQTAITIELRLVTLLI